MMMPKDSSPWGTSLLGGSSTGTSGGGANTNTNTNSRGATGMGAGGSSTPLTATVTAGNTGSSTSLPSSNSYAFLASSTVVAAAAATPSSLLVQGGGGVSGMGGSAVGLMPAVVSHDRSQELCKYFLNGGCLRGDQCQYLHELPDERHLDVNGYGYILNPNVHNAQKTLPLAMSSNPSGAVQVNGGALASSPLMLGLNSGSSRQAHGTKAKQQVASFMVGVPTHLPLHLSAPAVKVSPPKYRPPEPFLEYNLPPTLALPFNTPTKEVAHQLTCTMLQN